MIYKSKAQEMFLKYTAPYCSNQDGKILLKVAHTLRVATLSERIATAEGLSKEEIDLAWLIGLLHDIGRFEQIRIYGTFNDAASIDHASYSVKVLFDEGHIRDYIESDCYDLVIKKAIAYHSIYKLPDELTQTELLFCNLIRDADKIDILQVHIDSPLETVLGSENAKNLPFDIVSDAVMQSIRERHAVLHSVRTTSVDHYVSHIALVFELIFNESFKIVKEQGYLDTLLNFPSQNEKTHIQMEEIQRNMKEFLSSHN